MSNVIKIGLALLFSFNVSYCMDQKKISITDMSILEMAIVSHKNAETRITTMIYHDTHSNEFIACAAFDRCSKNNPNYMQMLQVKKKPPRGMCRLKFFPIKADVFTACFRRLVEVEVSRAARSFPTKLASAKNIRESIKEFKASLQIEGELNQEEMQKLENRLVGLEAERYVEK